MFGQQAAMVTGEAISKSIVFLEHFREFSNPGSLGK